MIRSFYFKFLFALFFGLNLLASEGNAQLKCADVFAKHNTSHERLQAVYDKTFERGVINEGAINPSHEFKHFSRQLIVQFPGGEDSIIQIFGRPYRLQGKDYVDISRDRTDTVLERIEFSKLFYYAMLGGFDIEVENSRAGLLLPKKTAGSKRGALDVFSFSKWVNYAALKIEVVSRTGEKRVVTLEEIFRNSLLADENTLGEINRFYDFGGRGDVFYASGEVDPTYHGLAIHVQSWPDKQKSSLPKNAANDPEMAAELKKLLEKKIPVVYFLGPRLFLAAASEGQRMLKHLENRLALDKQPEKFLIVTEMTTSDTLVHEVQHLDDYASGFHRNLAMELEKRLINSKMEVKDKSEGELLTKAYIGVLKLITEQRAYAVQSAYLQKQAESGKIDQDRVYEAYSVRIQSFRGYYVNPLNSAFARLISKYPDHVSYLADIVQKNLVENGFVHVKFDAKYNEFFTPLN